MDNVLPITLEKCPIVDSLIEIRFEANFFKNAVFGLIYDVLKDDFSGRPVTSLPILQMPEQLRDIDPNLHFKPHYSLMDEHFVVQIGPDVLSIAAKNPYPGWKVFSAYAFSVIDRVIKKNIIKKVLRIGHRYINFFDSDILPNLTIKLELQDSTYSLKNSLIRSVIEDVDGFVHTLQISNDAQYNNNEKNTSGSIIDIDTFKEFRMNDITNYDNSNINTAHDLEKKLFFSLLKDSFLKELSPKY